MSRGHVDVTERRLKPIYEALDTHNNKKAIQLADKLLKKQDLLCAKVLKALALLRSGRDVESWNLIDDAKKKRPYDDASLNAMSLFFREARKPEYIVEIFEVAVKDDPTNEEYMTHLFMAYVRLNEYKRQQQVGMSLFKLVPKNPYYYWSVMSIVMQAHASDDVQLTKKTLLSLAERMIEKNVKENKMESEAELRLYVMVLRQQNKHEAALTVLQGELSALWQDESEKEQLEREILWTLKRWPVINQIAKRDLRTDSDNWGLYQLYFDSVFGLMEMQALSIATDNDAGDNVCDDDLDRDVLTAWKFVDSLVAKELEKKGAKLRGPFMARMELVNRSRQHGVGQHLADVATPLQMFCEYYDLFGDRYCCYSDVDNYLHLMDDSQQSEFLTKLRSQAALSSSSDEAETIERKALNVMQRHICALQLSRTLGTHTNLSVADKKTLSEELIQHFKNGIKYGKGLLETDLRPNDNYALLAAHLIIDIAVDLGDMIVYWDAVGILEEALLLSPSNPQIQLLLVRIYSILGVFDPCARIFNSMEIRNIQLDTLGYLFLSPASSLGYFKTARKLAKMTLAYFFMSKKDTPEYVVSAYRSGSFHKILEIIQFQQKVQRSITFPMTVYDSTAFDVLVEASSLDEICISLSNATIWAVAQFFHVLLDNRDTKVLDTWDPPNRRLTNEQVKLSFDLDMEWLKIRSGTFRSLYLIVSMLRLVTPVTTPIREAENSIATISDGVAELEGVFSELQGVVESLQQNSKVHTKFPIQGPPRNRIIPYLEGGHSEVLLNLISVAITLFRAASVNWTATECADCQKATNEAVARLLLILGEQSQRCSKSLCVGTDNKRQFSGFCLEPLVFLTETFCHTLVVLAAFSQVLEPQQSSKKQKKKTKNQELVVAFNSLKSSMKPVQVKVTELMVELKSELSQVKEEIIAENLTSLSISTVDDDAVQAKVLKHARDSYTESLEEIADVLDKKLKFAATIQW
ncbi:N-alpha-acetyltransferase 25, NatB auxiliary subunit-like [Corticium candelabrum]|uniref:N-alpha-acetyltransferase 25, NatB auxiliary subunit-like n=1 Tax=Corticium candelabrum TaxID=121492 RepID=UPI002E26EAFC|nr:N-alpha-acetyltransferase 25, NatB auxiliary subunit-like [Corticium candelabrum]